MLDTVKENPIPSIIAGLSVGWLAVQGSKSSSDGRHSSGHGRSYEREPVRRTPYEAEHRAVYAHGEHAPDVEVSTGSGRASEESHSTHGKAQQKAGKAKQKTKQKAGKAKQKAGHMAGQARGEMKHLGRQTQQQMRRTKSGAQRMLHENPMALGAVTLAAGAFVGLLAPETRKEDEMMGRKRDQMMHKAKSKAKEAMHRAEDVAKKTAQQAKSTAKEETKKQKNEMQQGTQQEQEPRPKQS